MIGVLRSTWALFVGIGCAVLSYGLQIPLLPVRAFDEGFGTFETGLIMAGHFVGICLGAADELRMFTMTRRVLAAPLR